MKTGVRWNYNHLKSRETRDWISAFAGMTEKHTFGLFTRSSRLIPSQCWFACLLSSWAKTQWAGRGPGEREACAAKIGGNKPLSNPHTLPPQGTSGSKDLLNKWLPSSLSTEQLLPYFSQENRPPARAGEWFEAQTTSLKIGGRRPFLPYWQNWWTGKKSSFSRRRESRINETHWKDWIPVFKGMTETRIYGLFTRSSKMGKPIFWRESTWTSRHKFILGGSQFFSWRTQYIVVNFPFYTI